MARKLFFFRITFIYISINIRQLKAQFKSDILKTISTVLSLGSTSNFTEINDAAMGSSSVDDIFNDCLYN